jgi:1-deoxy-D-xylulose-5-phosphate reductoisomerase
VKRIALLGSTGSIGESTLSLLREHQGLAKVKILSAHQKIDELLKQIGEFQPEKAFLTGAKVKAQHIEKAKSCGCELIDESAELFAALEDQELDTVVLAMMGAAGLPYGLKALEQGKRLAIANKEPLVIAGHLFKAQQVKNDAEIIPIDSEHSAIFQCLFGESKKDVERLILTSSGGPFHHYQDDQFQNILAKDALKHPTWVMGQKITIDSASMMNKGLEMLEAKWLFDQPLSKIDVTVHRQSIVHSMVEYCDGSILAQLGVTDMKFPILYALTYPERYPSHLPRLDFKTSMSWTFDQVNPFLNQAIELIREVGDDPVSCILLNAANECYVENFLKTRVPFLGIYDHLKAVIEKGAGQNLPVDQLSDVSEVDLMGRQWSRELIES